MSLPLSMADEYRQCLPSTLSLLMPSLPPPPLPPNTISSPIMLEQLNSSSKNDTNNRNIVDFTYRRLETNDTPIGECKPGMSPVSSPGGGISVSSSPALPIESASTNGKEIQRRPPLNNIIEHAMNEPLDDPLAKLQNALESGFLGRKLFSPLTDNPSHQENTVNERLTTPQQQQMMKNALRLSPDCFMDPEDPSKKEIIYRCHLCEFKTNEKQHFNSHVNTHFDHKCNFCDYTSRTEGRLKRHVKDFHSEIPPNSWAGTRVPRRGEDPVSSGESNGSASNASKSRNFKCKQCEHVAKTKNEFWEHSKAHIKSEKLLTCPKCPFVTEYKHHLEYHLRNHFGSKPFKCGKCNYSCVNKSMLNSHLKSHSNIYQYRCRDCSYATKYCHSLKLHLRKYIHEPATVLNLDGSVNPYPVIDVYGTRRGPRPKRKLDDKGKGHHKKMANAVPVVSSTISPSSQATDSRALVAAPYSQMMSSQVAAQNQHWMYQSHLMASFHAGMFASRPTLLPQDQIRPDAGQFYCPFCNYNTDDHELLSKHIMGHAAAENQDLINMYGMQPEASRDDSSNHSSPSVVNGEQSNRKTPSSEEMEISRSPPPCTVSSRAVSPDDLTEEYNQDDPGSASQSFNDDINPDDEESRETFEQREPNVAQEAINIESMTPISQPLLETPPKGSSESISCPLDLSHPREDKCPQSTSSSRNRRKGKAFKLSRVSLQIHDPAPEDGDDESENYHPATKSNRAGDKNETTGTSSSRMASPFKEINKSLCISYKLPEVSIEELGKEADAVYESSPDSRKDYHLMDQLVEKQSPTSSSAEPGAQKNSGENWNAEVYKCNYCDISFGNCVMYTVHMGYHGYQDPFKCNMCGQESKDKVEFFLHIARSPHLFG